MNRGVLSIKTTKLRKGRTARYDIGLVSRDMTLFPSFYAVSRHGRVGAMMDSVEVRFPERPMNQEAPPDERGGNR